jgi:WS/DGAT/MGAT family acyltransferase
VLEDPDEVRERVSDAVGAVWDTLKSGLRSSDDTPLNGPIGSYRRFDWLELDLAEVKDIKNRLGGTVNDVVLTTVAGALKRFFDHRRFSSELIDFRSVVPVSVRSAEERGKLGNRVAAWITSLPIQEHDPLTRFAKVQETTRDLKQAKSALGAEVLTQMAEWMGSTTLSLGVRLANRTLPYNLIVTNVPGPQVPFYLLGAKMLGSYPQAPLFENQRLAVALFSYMGKIIWGFNADWDHLPDLHYLVKAVRSSHEELRDAAAAREIRRAPRATPKRRRSRANRAAGRPRMRLTGTNGLAGPQPAGAASPPAGPRES